MKPVVFLACLVPLARLVARVVAGRLGANPAEFLEHATGDWTLRFVILTLCVTPLRRIPGLNPLIRFRRMLGLFAFFYGCLHVATYLTFDLVFDLRGLWADVMKRRYITAGFTGFVLMIPLAVTSTAGWVRRLGGRRWAALHRAIYGTAVAGVVHYVWLVKSDIRVPLAYAAVVAILLAWRVRTCLAGTGRSAAAR